MPEAAVVDKGEEAELKLEASSEEIEGALSGVLEEKGPPPDAEEEAEGEEVAATASSEEAEASAEPDKDAVIAELRKELDAAKASTNSEEAEAEPELPALAVEQFLPEGVDSLDELSREDANQLLNRVASHAVKLGYEHAIRAIPNIVRHNVTMQLSMAEAVKDFYAANPELTAYKKVVAQQAQNVASEHTDWTVGQVFEEAGVKAREQLKLAKRAVEKKRETEKKGGFAPVGGARGVGKAKPNLTDVEKQIAEMDAALL